jgi:hypothetical protein
MIRNSYRIKVKALHLKLRCSLNSLFPTKQMNQQRRKQRLKRHMATHFRDNNGDNSEIT